MDGRLTPEEMKEAVKLAIHGCEQIYEVQRQALTEKYLEIRQRLGTQLEMEDEEE